MSATYPVAKARAEHLAANPNADVQHGGLCQKVARTIVNTQAFGSSAQIACKASMQHLHAGQVLAGGMVYFENPNVPDSKEFWHAAFAIESGMVWSTDILKFGHLDLVHWTVIRDKWHMRLVGTIDATPYDTLHMAPVPAPKPPVVTLPAASLNAVIAAATHDPARPQGGVTPGAKDDVLLVERALVEVGLLGKSFVDGSFGTRTRDAYANWQRKTVPGPYDGIPGRVSLTALGKKTGNFRVVT